MNKSCVLIGCGPSLNKVNIRLLSEFDSITFNRAYIAFHEWCFFPTYYACIDRVVLPDNAIEIRKMIKERKIKHFYLRDAAQKFGIPEQDNVTHLHIIEGAPFSTDLKNLGMFGNVGAVSLQILACIGYERIVLVGVDAKYIQVPPDIRIEPAYNYIHHTNVNTVDYVHLENNDPNHFSPFYYGKGKRENRPNVAKAVAGWERASVGCLSLGIEVRNASPGSALKCFPHIDFQDAIKWLRS